MEHKMISRELAIETLQELLDCDFLSERMANALEEIQRCIEAENDGIHIWDAEDDYRELYISHRADVITDELREQNRQIREKYAFTPSPNEA